MKVSAKRIIITGAGNGIGRELALQLMKKGSFVIAIDRDAEALAETSRLAGSYEDCLNTVPLDVTDRALVEEKCEMITEKFGPVDGLINDAGIIQPFVDVKDIDYAHIERVMGVNFFGTLYMIKSLLPHLMTRPEAHIMNISSMGGFLPVPGQTIYGASKAAVKLLTEGLHAELADTHVKVTLVMPGAIDTHIAEHSGNEPIRVSSNGDGAIPMLSAGEAAENIIEAMERDRYRVLIGKDAKSMDLMYRFNPLMGAKMMRRKMRSLIPGR